MMKHHKKFFSKIGFNYLIFGLTALISQIILLNLLNCIDINIYYNYNTAMIITATCNYLLPLPVIVYLMRKIKREKIEKKKLKISTFLTYIAISLTLMWIGNLTGILITQIIGTLIQNPISNPIEEIINSTDIWLNMFLISIIGPVFEEYLFRKLLIDRTIRYGAGVSILLSAILFGFFHGNINQFFYAFLIGGFFAYVYIQTGKITYSIILHIIINLLGSVVSIFVMDSANRIAQNISTATDITAVFGYALLITILFAIGLIELYSLTKNRLNKTTAINLKNQLKDIICNYGMICFIAFFVIEMIIQIY